MRRVAYEIVARGVACAVLAIAVTFIGLCYDVGFAAKVAALLFSLLAVGLVLRGRIVAAKPYRQTELWRALPRELRPPELHAQWASATVNREAYLAFARYTGAGAAALWVVALGLAALPRAAGF
jgi:hypothetical protein